MSVVNLKDLTGVEYKLPQRASQTISWLFSKAKCSLQFTFLQKKWRICCFNGGDCKNKRLNQNPLPVLDSGMLWRAVLFTMFQR